MENRIAATAADATEPLRVLIVAEHASAQFGGEAALALHYFRVFRARGLPVWLLTHARRRDELSALFPGESRIRYIEDSKLHRWLHRLGRHLPARISFFTLGFVSRLSTQLQQRSVVRELVRAEGIDVVHQPMPVSPREPSMLYGFGVPVVIGPMNGGMDYPPGMKVARGRFERALFALGTTASGLLNRVMPGKRKAALLFVANERTRRALPRGVNANVQELVENGVDLTLWRPSPPRQARGAPLLTTFVFMGRLVALKAVDVLLRAFAQARVQAPMRLIVIGEGVERRALEALARALGIAAAGDEARKGEVGFAGWLTQRACAGRLADADVLVMPSIHECGGAVVLEAMAMGKPVIATAWGGPLDYLDADCGVLVPPIDAQQLEAGFAAAMVNLARSPEVRGRLGATGRAKVLRDYDWEVKADRMIALYRSVLRADAA